MRVLQDAWRYLTDGASWTGDQGMLELLLQQLLLTAGALALALAVGLPLALWLGHLGRGGFLAVNVSNVGRAIPTFALLAILVTADPWGWTGGYFPGTATLGPFGRAGAVTLVALALFALPPILTNAYTAVREVPPEVQALLSKPISELSLSVRARKCMSKLNIQTVGDLAKRSGDELLECKNFGVTSLNEVRDKLSTLGLKLKND